MRLSRKYGGMGLGLPISRAFVEALGGVINCSSEPGVGGVLVRDSYQAEAR